MRTVQIIAIILLGLYLIPTTLSLIAGGMALAQNGPNDSYTLGTFMGSLVVELVLLVIISRIFKALRRR
ncbi:hypothetical protein F8S13_02265 [Chloroflexia bacterium SDU3-3]|nr:hypothetical protein F8S13_02265 [Chloroflexia bacterium SDU3-3]